MPLWPTAPQPASERVREHHHNVTGTSAVTVAHAPATWMLIGEQIDHFGGVVVAGLSDLQAAAAVSPRTDGKISVRQFNYELSEVAELSDSITLDELADRLAAQQPEIDDHGRTILPPAPEGGLAARNGGIVSTMITRQLMSRETAGADITIVNDIPDHSGLGAQSAQDVAVALALLGKDHDLNDAPLRARIAEICTQAVETFAAEPPLRARHSAALRGSGETVSVVDYADGSITQALHPLTHELQAFVLAVPGGHDNDAAAKATAEIIRRQRFIDDACHAFGAESLRLLPDAPERVIDWLQAVHDVHGPEDQPAVHSARAWLDFYVAETARAQRVVRALRSRRGVDLFPQLIQSQAEILNSYGLDTAHDLAQLAQTRGAAAARAASAGTANAVIAYVPAARSENFAADMADDGLVVVPLSAGKVAAQAD